MRKKKKVLKNNSIQPVRSLLIELINLIWKFKSLAKNPQMMLISLNRKYRHLIHR